jgi:hypothetical protein
MLDNITGENLVRENPSEQTLLHNPTVARSENANPVLHIE